MSALDKLFDGHAMWTAAALASGPVPLSCADPGGEGLANSAPYFVTRAQLSRLFAARKGGVQLSALVEFEERAASCGAAVEAWMIAVPPERDEKISQFDIQALALYRETSLLDSVGLMEARASVVGLDLQLFPCDISYVATVKASAGFLAVTAIGAWRDGRDEGLVLAGRLSSQG